MLLFEELLILLTMGAGVLLVGVPLWKILRAIVPAKRNALAEAKERLEKARIDIEAARLDKETSELYDKMYKEVLEDEEAASEEAEAKKVNRRIDHE